MGLALFVMSMGGGVQLRAERAFDWVENVGRSQVWQANLDMVRERPLFGWGYGNYKKFRDPYYQRYPKADTTAHAHNNFLQIWVDTGLVGLGAFLMLFWAMLRLSWQTYRTLPEFVEPLRGVVLGGLLSIVAFLIGGLTQYNFGDAEVVIVMWATAGLLIRMSTNHVTHNT
jgi:O-antigen ligase